MPNFYEPQASRQVELATRGADDYPDTAPMVHAHAAIALALLAIVEEIQNAGKELAEG
jgi:hypothetical protein